jgi:hypothetical protein
MDLDVFLLTDFVPDKEVTDITTLVTLNLNNLSVIILVCQYCSVSREHLLECLENLLKVKIISETRDCGQTFASITLLYTDMYNTLLLISGTL